MKKCIFCKIIADKVPVYKIYENNYVLVFAPLEKDIIAKGHMLITSKKHYCNIYDIPQKELNHVTKAAKMISQKLKDKYQVAGVNILHASGKVAQQSCFHFHFHLIPRYKHDHLDTWPKTNYKEINFPDIYKELKNIF